jgi:DNA-binding PadR family transcriptional regulator
VTVKKKDVLQGTLALLVLKTLASHRKLHGYITSHIHAISDDRLRVEEALYPALHRMEQAGWLKAEWGVTAGALAPADRRRGQRPELHLVVCPKNNFTLPDLL